MRVTSIIVHTSFVSFFVFCYFFLSGHHIAYGFDPYLSFTVTPPYPGAHETVSVDLVSYGIDLSTSTISWYVDGVKKNSEIGATQLTFITGDIGHKTTVSVSISSPEGVTIQKSLVLSISELDLLWEASDSYTPPFYRGKALPASGATIKVVAFPNMTNATGNKVSDTNLVYTWSINSFKSDVVYQSGYGKNILMISKNIFDLDQTVSVDVTVPNSTNHTSTKLFIPTTNPEVLLYEQRPLFGVWYTDMLSDQLRPTSKQVSVIAEPFYFSLPTKNPDTLSYTWAMNGTHIPSDGEHPRIVTFGVPDNTAGTTSVSLSVEHPLSLFQSATRQIAVLFDTQAVMRTFPF